MLFTWKNHFTVTLSSPRQKYQWVPKGGGEGEGGGGRLPIGIPSRGKKQYPESFYNMETDVNSYSVG